MLSMKFSLILESIVTWFVIKNFLAKRFLHVGIHYMHIISGWKSPPTIKFNTFLWNEHFFISKVILHRITEKGGVFCMNEFRTKSLKRISLWGQLLGITFMIFGGIYALMGIFAFIVGAIPGFITVAMGYFLYLSGKSAKNLLFYVETREDEQNDEYDKEMNTLLDSYGKFLLINGILFLIAVAIYVLFFIFLGIYGVEMLEGL